MITMTFDPELESIRKDLAALADELQDKIIYRAVVSAGAPYKKAMKRTAPGETGALKDSIVHRKLRPRDKAALGLGNETAGILVGPLKRVPVRTLTYNVDDGSGGSVSVTVRRFTRRSRVAQILEEGAAPHVVVPKKKGDKLAIKGGKFAPKVSHPGIRAFRFMQKAHDSVGSQPNELFYRSLSRQMDKVNARTA